LVLNSGRGDALLIHDEFTPAGIETGAQFIVPAGILSSGKIASGRRLAGLGSGISSCKMWRVQAHMFVVVFSHRIHCRKLVSS
jgi:hypothetical protein